MTLENIYYIGQTIAVALIFPTLVFLAVQNRQSQKQMNRANEIARAEFSGRFMSTHKELTLRIVDDAKLADAFRELTIDDKRIEDRSTLTRLLAWFGSYYTLWQDMCQANKHGLVDEQTCRVVSGNMGFYASNRLVWDYILNVTEQRELNAGAFEESISALAALRDEALAHKSDLAAQYDAEPDMQLLAGDTNEEAAE